MSQITRYKINSQKHAVDWLQEQFDNMTKIINDEFPKEDLIHLQMLTTLRNTLIQAEEQLENMRKEISL